MLAVRTMTLLMAAVVSLFLLAGCRNGPRRSDVQASIQTTLDESFSPGLFRIRHLKRRGHYPYTPEGDERDHVLVYYDAELELARDHTLSDWDALNVGSLISVLGATPKGVKGVKAEGNEAGDVLHVHGAAAFAKEGDGWQRSRFVEQKKKRGEPAPSDIKELPHRRKMEQIAELGKKLHVKAGREDLRHLTEELERVRAATERRIWKRDGVVTISTGNEAGEYHRQGAVLAELLSEENTKSRALPSSGSIENVGLVEGKEVPFAYCQNDIVHMAYKGTGLFKRQIPMQRLRALTTLYPEAVHVVARQDRGISAVAGLKGRKVDVGVAGSGGRINAVEVLEAAGLGLHELGAVQGKSTPQALADLERGHVDAIIFTSAFPNPLLRDLAQKVPLVVLPVQADALVRLQERSPFIIEIQLPKKTYPGMGGDRTTAGVTAMLIAHDAVPDEWVTNVLETLFSYVDRLSEGSPPAYLISREKAKTGLSVPLHPAAKRWLEADK